ncbi:MAG: hypothetical protein ACC656_08405, partial [Candidatus Heimdallarchaeota archaeon]
FKISIVHNKIVMRKVKDRPKEIAAKIVPNEGFDLFIDLKNGKLSKRHSVYSVPVKEIESDKKGYKKLELITGGTAVYHNKSQFNDKFVGRRIQNIVIIEGVILKFAAFHKTAVSRLLFDCHPALIELMKKPLPKRVMKILEWTEWHAYRTSQKSLRIRHYSHQKFYSDHAKKINGMAGMTVLV